MKMKKVKKIIGWIVLAIIVGGVLSVPVIALGWVGLASSAISVVLVLATAWSAWTITED